MKFQVNEISSVIRQEIASFRSELDVRQVGRVVELGDGVARIYGLSEAMNGEVLSFASGAMGQVFNLEEDSVGAVIFGSYEKIKEGDEVRGTGKLLEVPVGDGILGRVVDPLGQPQDGRGEIVTMEHLAIERPTAGITARQPVNEPLQTGIKAIDSMTAIGRGQRELIIGDRKTGKTAIAIDTILNQKHTGVICVYVAVGQKESTVADVVQTLRRHGAMDYCVIVSASSADPAPLQYIAPYAGCAIAEYFTYTRGADTLVVYDDLSKQAAAYRQLSLLLRRPPGREAYPGDVFYLHSRLLERAVKLAEEFIIAPINTPDDVGDASISANGKTYRRAAGRLEADRARSELPEPAKWKVHPVPTSGGSITALPIVETLAGEVAAYIPTNVISITDGQIYLEPDLFFAGVRPAINVGISVSRVGGKAQRKAMKKVAGSLRLDLAAYRELATFAQLGSELDATTQAQLDRGARLVELLKQPRYEPFSLIDQVFSLFAGTRGLLDEVPIESIRRCEREMIEYLHVQHEGICRKLGDKGDLDVLLERKLTAAIQKFVERFTDIETATQEQVDGPTPEDKQLSELEKAAQELGLDAERLKAHEQQAQEAEEQEDE